MHLGLKIPVTIYENLQSITNQVIAELESQFGEEYATDSCARDLKIIIASVAEDVGRGGNSATISSTNRYFDAHDALEGERSESVFAFEYARELCIEFTIIEAQLKIQILF